MSVKCICCGKLERSSVYDHLLHEYWCKGCADAKRDLDPKPPGPVYQWDAWLILNGKTGEGLRYLSWWSEGPSWVVDPLEALHFSRRMDAERILGENEDAWGILLYRFPSDT